MTDRFGLNVSDCNRFKLADVESGFNFDSQIDDAMMDMDVMDCKQTTRHNNNKHNKSINQEMQTQQHTTIIVVHLERVNQIFISNRMANGQSTDTNIQS